MGDDLNVFRQSAAAMRSRAAAFAGFTFCKFNGESGAWIAGKEGARIDGRRVIAAVPDLLAGWQKFEDSKPIHSGIGRIRDRRVPPPRDTLGDTNTKLWRKKDVDPWMLTWYLAFYDVETRETLIYTTASGGGRDALAALQDVFADHNEGAAALEWPLVELDSDSYVNSFGKTIHVPMLDVVGWEPPPAGFKSIAPPADTPQITRARPVPLLEPARGAPATEMDDEIPF